MKEKKILVYASICAILMVISLVLMSTYSHWFSIPSIIFALIGKVLMNKIEENDEKNRYKGIK